MPKKDHLFKKGVSGNPKGRPKGSGVTPHIPDDCKSVMKELAVGYAMDPKHPKHHEYLMKFMDKLFPSLKSQELKIDTDSEAGFVFMPTQKPSKKDVDEDKVLN